MNRERIQIFFRKKQLQNEGVDVLVTCVGGVASYVPGTITDNPWVDMTEFTTGLEKLDLSWDAVNSSNGGSNGTSTQGNQVGSNYDKGISLELVFNDAAYQFIYNWLLSGPCDVLNAVEVKLTDALAGKTYRRFDIKADNLNYRPFDEPCEITVRLREQDGAWHCIHKTFIWDNWQGWFENGSSKQHPCFLTCIETRPRILQSARMGLHIFLNSSPLVFSGPLGIIFLDEIFDQTPVRRILNMGNFVPAPLIRDILDNAAGKCGFTMDTIFDDVPENAYRDLCLYHPIEGAWHKNDAGTTSPALWYFMENRWNITIAELLDKLKPVFNAEWYVTPNNQLIFKPLAELLNVAAIYDFSAPGAEAFNELEYTMNGVKRPAYGRYQYSADGSDLASQEMHSLYNDIVDYDGPINNEMLEGEKTKNFEFAPTGFIKDGKSEEEYLRATINDGEKIAYILIAILVVIIASQFAGVLTAGAAAALAVFLAAWAVLIAIQANIKRAVVDNATYHGAVRLTSEQTGTPRLLLWDGVSFNRAKVVDVASNDIDPNPYYNPTLNTYDDENGFKYTKAGVFNYPMYFDSKFLGNLYPEFHDAIDNPLVNPTANQTFRGYVDLCEDFLNLFGVWEGEFVKIGYLIKLEDRPTYEVFGRIKRIGVQYETERIIVSGEVIFKAK
jgi:hypothetical protein